MAVGLLGVNLSLDDCVSVSDIDWFVASMSRFDFEQVDNPDSVGINVVFANGLLNHFVFWVNDFGFATATVRFVELIPSDFKFAVDPVSAAILLVIV